MPRTAFNFPQCQKMTQNSGVTDLFTIRNTSSVTLSPPAQTLRTGPTNTIDTTFRTFTAQPMQRILPAALILLTLVACQSLTTTKQTAELMDDAAQAKSKINNAETLANEIKTAKTPEARERATAVYVTASETALTDASQTIDKLKNALIASEDTAGKTQAKLSICEADLSIWHFIKWPLIIILPLALFGAFMAGRKL